MVRRHRGTLSLLFVITIALGLASRRFGAQLPHFIAEYAGDTLWATMVFWLLALAFPGKRAARLAIGAILIAWADECSQLYHAPWIDAIRATRAGALALGNGFLWTDMICYVAGVGIAVLIDVVVLGANGGGNGTRFDRARVRSPWSRVADHRHHQ